MLDAAMTGLEEEESATSTAATGMASSSTAGAESNPPQLRLEGLGPNLDIADRTVVDPASTSMPSSLAEECRCRRR